MESIRFLIFAICALLKVVDSSSLSQAESFECHNETYNFEGGNLVVMSWHIHYLFNPEGFYSFCTTFEKQFAQYFDPEPEDGPMCPFGPNFDANTYPYICSLERCSNFLDKSSSAGDPWNDPQRAFVIPVELIEETWEWSKNNKFETDLFRHPNTGCMTDDHGIRGIWDLYSGIEHSINILEFPCNEPYTGCIDKDYPGPPSCGCSLPLLSDKLEDSCGNCINQYTPPTPYLKPDCTVSPLQVNYEHVKYYNGKVNCGNLFLEADIGGGINIPPAVIYPNDEINVDEYYILIMVDPDADLADNGSWNYDSPNPTPGSHAPVRHWVLGNIDGISVLSGVDQSITAVNVAPFKGPSPPYGSHRYGFFLFRQFEGKMVDWEPLRAQWEEENSIIEWNYQAFIFEYNLQLVASNWHITQHFEAREE